MQLQIHVNLVMLHKIENLMLKQMNVIVRIDILIKDKVNVLLVITLG